MQTLSQRKQELSLLPQTNMKGLVLLLFCYAYSIALFITAAWVTSIFLALKGTVLSKVPFLHLLGGSDRQDDRTSKGELNDHSRAAHLWGQR